MQLKLSSLIRQTFLAWIIKLSFCGVQSYGQSFDPFQDIIKSTAMDVGNPGVSEKDAQKAIKAMQLGNFRVLAIGEQSHGTSEFFQLRTSLIKALTSENRVTKIGLEAPMAEVSELNKVVLGTGGDISQILKTFRLYGFECSEFVELVNAVKSINSQRNEKIIFFGFDIQSPFQVLENLLRSFPENDKNTADSLRKLIDNYRLLNDQVYSHTFSEQDFEEQNSLSQYVLKRYQQLNTKDSILDKQVEAYRQFLLLNEPRHSRDMAAMSLIRDSIMAVNVYKELAPSDKIVILAHNAHIQKTVNPFSKSMGLFLCQKLGSDYKTIGLTTFSGFYTAFNGSAGKITNSNEVVPGDKNTFEFYFNQLGKPIFLLNTAMVKNKLKAISVPERYRLLVYGLMENQFFPGNLLDDFDFVLHINHTTGNKSFYLK